MDKQTTTIYLDREKHKAIRMLAVEEEKSFNQLITEAIVDKLKEKGKIEEENDE